MFKMSFSVNLAPLNKLQRIYEHGMTSQGFGPIRRAVERMCSIYMQSMFERFNRFSMGNGTWPRLREKTIKDKGHDAILVDTYTLRNAIDPRSRFSSQIVEGHMTGFSVGIQSNQAHPKSKLTVSQLAAVHHSGKGRVPVREILVNPDGFTHRKMAQALSDGIKDAIRQAGA